MLESGKHTASLERGLVLRTSFLVLFVCAACLTSSMPSGAAAGKGCLVGAAAVDITTVDVPAPWLLTGSGYIMVLQFTPEALAHDGFIPETLKDKYKGGWAMVMVADYYSSDAGPYRELLFVPGSFLIDGRRCWSITKIYVTTQKSVVNGQANWGIPKEKADMQIMRADNGTEFIHIADETGAVVADLQFDPGGLTLPVWTGFIPRFLRMFGQHWDGQTFLFAPSAAGLIAPAKLLKAEINPQHFPDINKARVLLTLKIPFFILKFPVSKIMQGLQ